MKTRKLGYLWLLCSFLLLLLSGCEEVFEKAINYRYRIQNNTSSTVLVMVQVKQNPGVIIQGDGTFYYSIGPGSAEVVYNTSGFASESVWDEEKGNVTLHWFTVAASKNGSGYNINFNDTQRWVFEKRNKLNANYTLTINEDDEEVK